jgi:sec-independent protein translocase protein TatB
LRTSNFCFIRPRVTIFNLERIFPKECVERYFEKVVLLILESLGSTELVFILVMALVFFGPRKLPQISRTLGKNLAEFRRASEDFKRTWDREVSLEDVPSTDSSELPGQSSILNPEMTGRPLQAPSIASVPPDQVIARQTGGSNPLPASDETNPEADRSDFENVTAEPTHSPKNDWL